MNTPHPGIKVNIFYEKYVIVDWYDFNWHQIVLVISKVLKTNPEPTPQRIPTIGETPPNDELSPCAN